MQADLAGARRPLSLRWRLAGWVALVVIASPAITFVAVYRGTGTQLRHQIDSEISGDADELARMRSPPRSRARSGSCATRPPRYIREQPFRASSTLLFVTIPGAGTVTNRPELFGSAKPDNGETPVPAGARERALGAVC